MIYYKHTNGEVFVYEESDIQTVESIAALEASKDEAALALINPVFFKIRENIAQCRVMTPEEIEAHINPPRKQAALAAGQARLHEIEQAIQSHINQTVAGLGMGFTDDNSLIGKYAGYDNVFRPIAEAVGKWVAEIWYLAAQDKAAIVAGKKAIPTVAEALAQIPPFVMPEQKKAGE